ncbi:MAG: hypothetical protein DMF86_14020 [Acidobacteria bacterium]|nr:MAG: hypothetical protein DMF86_14020 [Acidobacteriota bacterium]
MDQDLFRNYRRWRSADEDGRNDEADAAFMSFFPGVTGDPPVSPDFAGRTMAEIAVVRARDARRARWFRVAFGCGASLGTAAAVYFGAAWLVTSFSSGLMRLLNLMVGSIVQVAAAAHTGADSWNVVSNLGRAAAAFAASPSVTMVILAMQGVAFVALVALQRLLRSDTESLR